MVRKIIDEENTPTETRIIKSFSNHLLSDLVTSTPTTNNDTDDSFYSALGESDEQPLIVSIETPEVKHNKTSRRALGCIKNRMVETPDKDMRRKLWRNMEDERINKKGVENTPPLPFKDITASAPPKLYRHRKFT